MNKIPLKEKIKLTSGQNNWHFFESAFVDGRKINVADGPHGVRVYKQRVEDGDFLSQRHLAETTLFPSASAMASTWNNALIEQVGETIGKECRHHQVDVLLGPGINLKRSPLGGRNFEYYSEDPYLTSKIGASFVKGVQQEKVGACIKHFGLNEQETMRRFVNVKIDERTLHEMYLYPFYKIIKEANPWMVMSSYNKLRGDYASESAYLLQDVLRDKWGYEGAVVSDWGAVQDKVKSIKHGMNVEMPGPSSFEGEVEQALKDGSLTETDLDESLEPLFKLHEKVKKIKPLDKVDLLSHHKIAQQVAREAMVLLENDGILPIKEPKDSILVVGEFAKQPRINGGGSATVKPHIQETPFQALEEVCANLTYAKGYEEDNTNEDLLREVREKASNVKTVLYFTGTTEQLETEGKDRPHLSLPEGHLQVLLNLAEVNNNVIVVLSNGSALDLRQVKEHSRAILETWFLGGAAGQAIKELLFGEFSPSGRLQETFPLKLEHTPHYPIFPQKEEVDYHKDLIMNGYRYYDTHAYDVMYPFGYGLSYAEILYKNIEIAKNVNNQQTYLTVSLTLENLSQIDAYETVQVYIKSNQKDIVKPSKELKGFKKVFVKRESTEEVEIHLPMDAFESYALSHEGFVVYNGDYEVLVGRNVRDIEYKDQVVIEEGIDYKPVMDINYPVNYLTLYHPTWAKYIEDNFRSLWWHEKEEPIWRIMDRFRRHTKMDDAKFETLMKKLKEDIHV